jgi:AraC-like DNA-binding protein
MNASATVGQAGLTAERYCRLYNPGLRIWMTSEGSGATYHCEYPRTYGEGRHQLAAYTLMLTINQIRHWVGADWSPLEVCAEPAVTRGLGRYDDLGTCRITCETGPTRIRVRRDLLAHPIPTGEGWIDRREALTRLMQSASPTRIEPSLRLLIRTYLPAGAPSAGQLARLLGTSVRSLQRRLAAQETTLSSIVDESRRERAMELIAARSVTVMEAALACGYTDAANFTRAFRRWTGLSPREYRHRQLLN